MPVSAADGPDLKPIVRLRFKKFRSAIAVEQVLETLESRTRFKNILERHRAIMPAAILSEANALLLDMDNEFATRRMAEHGFHVEKLSQRRAAFEKLLRSLGHQQSQQGSR